MNLHLSPVASDSVVEVPGNCSSTAPVPILRTLPSPITQLVAHASAPDLNPVGNTLGMPKRA